MVELIIFLTDSCNVPSRHLNFLGIYPQTTKSCEVGALITILTRKSGQEEATHSWEQV